MWNKAKIWAGRIGRKFVSLVWSEGFLYCALAGIAMLAGEYVVGALAVLTAFLVFLIDELSTLLDDIKEAGAELAERNDSHETIMADSKPLFKAVLSRAIEIAEEEEDYEQCAKIRDSMEWLEEYYGSEEE